MDEAGLQELENYVSCHQNTVTQLIEIRPIMDLFMVAERRPGSQVDRRWWEQEGLELEGMQTAARGTEQEEEGEDTDWTETDTDD